MEVTAVTAKGCPGGLQTQSQLGIWKTVTLRDPRSSCQKPKHTEEREEHAQWQLRGLQVKEWKSWGSSPGIRLQH